MKKEITHHQITFQGDEIGDRWSFLATAEGYRSELRTAIPDAHTIIPFRLVMQQLVKVEVSYQDHLLSSDDYTLNVCRKRDRINYDRGNKKNEIVFVGDEIDRKWKIEIIYNNDVTLYGKAIICPRDLYADITINIALEEDEKRPKKRLKWVLFASLILLSAIIITIAAIWLNPFQILR